jgi:hypothetical protein
VPFILNSCGDNKDEPDSQEHEWVDLGLPSGTLWATMNVGATKPEEYGDYFAWGETEPKSIYNWSSYKWCNGSNRTFTKYCTLAYYGDNDLVDGKTELDPEDDAAYINWGKNWRTPTMNQIEELIDKCTWKLTTRNAVNGYLVTGPNGASLFLPAAGWRSVSELIGEGTDGRYFSRTLCSDNPRGAGKLKFYFDGWRRIYDGNRYYGLSIRAVRVQ